MKKFIAIYYSTPEALAQSANMTPEEMAKGMEPWMQWNAKVGDKMVDLGAPLMPGNQLNTKGDWLEGSKLLSGYSIVQAESLEDAKTLFDGHPHLAWDEGASIEVHEAVEM